MEQLILITVIVLVAFQDKNDHKTQYTPGQELKVDKERADDLIIRGLAKLKRHRRSQIDQALRIKDKIRLENDKDATADSKGTEK